jgi:hypothetical protein
MTLVDIAKYALKDFPTSRECSGLVMACATLAHEYDIHTIAGLTIAPLGTLFKNWDEFNSGRMIFADWKKVYITAWKYSASKSDTPTKEVLESVGRAVVSSSVALKWMATVGGVVVLRPHVKLFGHIKNMTSFCLACVSLNDAYKKMEEERTTGSLKGKARWLSTLQITALSCSIFLTGIGGLDSYIGKEPFIDRGWQRVSPATFATVGIFVSSTKILKAII